jgi:diguanylate cyclase (GGDEF)-like protein/PAS domain S-box-containing protein
MAASEIPRKIRILLLEDNPADVALEIRELKRAGLRFEHSTADSEPGLISALAAFKPDLILSDFSMPGFDGMAALAIAKARAPDTPFVFVSGTLGEDYAIRALKNGATDYVLKANLARLPACVEKSIEQAASQRDLRRAEVALARAQDMASLAHVITGAGGVFESWSRTLPSLIGVDPAQMPASTREWLGFVHPDDRETFRAKSIDSAKSGRRSDVDYRILRGDGKVIHVRQIVEPLTDASQGRWFNTLQDVTSQVEAQAAARQAEDNYRSVFDNATVGIFVVSPGGRVVSANPALARLLGYETAADMLTGINSVARQVYVDADARKTYRHLLRTQAEVSGFETKWRRRDGREIWVSLHGREVRHEDGSVVHQLGIAEDITQRKEAETQIKRLNRVYAVLSGINSSIGKVQTQAELFREICQISVNVGGFKIAWVGKVDEGAKRLTLAASAGAAAGYVELAPKELDQSGETPLGMAARAVVLSAPVVSNDFENDARLVLKAQARERGLRSLAALPLSVDARVVAVLTLYAEVADFFDDQEMQLLTELAQDISFALAHLAKKERLDFIAFYDELTGLANRRLLMDRLAVAVGQNQSESFAFVLVNIERFKSVNDSLGRSAGDAVLIELAARLIALTADPNRVAHIGADQFAVIVPGVGDEDRIAQIIQSGIASVEGEAFALGERELRIAVNAGISVFPADGTEPDTLFRNAEAALKKAKSSGEKYLFYTQKMTERVSERLALESKLRTAIERDEFILHYQPKVAIDSRQIVGLEALIRWQSPDGLIPPLKFIPLLEETGLIMQVGSWALRRAALDHRAWVEKGLRPPRIAVNVSPIQLRRRDFVSSVEAAILEGMAPVGIDLEITESLIMDDVEANIEKLRQICGLGMQIAIDDFGTGYSSLGYLARLPVHSLKIDRSFIISMEQNPQSMTLVSTIISMAHSLKLKVVAEGVETETQANFLRLLRCDEAQGYLFSKPVSAEEISNLIRAP